MAWCVQREEIGEVGSCGGVAEAETALERQCGCLCEVEGGEKGSFGKPDGSLLSNRMMDVLWNKGPKSSRSYFQR